MKIGWQQAIAIVIGSAFAEFIKGLFTGAGFMLGALAVWGYFGGVCP